MSRKIGTLGSEIVKTDLRLAWCLYIGLPEEVHAWTGIGTLSFLGQQWSGIGALGSISGLSESTDGSPAKMQFSLSGIDPNLYDYLVEQPYRGAEVKLYAIAVDAAFLSVVAARTDPLFSGTLTEVTLIDGSQISIQIGVEDDDYDQMRQRVRRDTSEEQQRRHPGDLFFEYKAQMANIREVWGKVG